MHANIFSLYWRKKLRISWYNEKKKQTEGQCLN